MFKRRLKYLFRSVSNITQKKECPNCKSTNLVSIDSKNFVTSLLKCKECELNHRHPKDSAKWLEKYYQQEYKIDTHMMTDLPSDSEIEELKKNNFKDLRSYDAYLNLLSASSPIKILDYGTSWGYNVFKLKNSNYDAVGFELSKPRANFGEEKLGVKIFSDLETVPNDLDIILSSHVIEHLIDLPSFFDFSRKNLKEDGVFMAFCPNGNKEYRDREEETWHGSWGDIHVNLLDLEFAKRAFKNNPYLILSGDWGFDVEEIKNWDGKSQVIGEKKDGKELLIIFKPNIIL
jgi:SAM-dependent methyltransferase